MRSQGEEHRYNPQTIHLLQESTRTGSYALFKEYTKVVDRKAMEPFVDFWNSIIRKKRSRSTK